MKKFIPGYATGNLYWLLRLEGLTIFLFALVAYEFLNFPWGFFVLVFFVPDLAMLGYFVNSKVGAIAYNTTHSYIIPLGLFAFGFYISSSDINKIALIWVAHIGFDRALGYGLKYSKGFRYTHLGKIGHQLSPEEAPHESSKS